MDTLGDSGYGTNCHPSQTLQGCPVLQNKMPSSRLAHIFEHMSPFSFIVITTHSEQNEECPCQKCGFHFYKTDALPPTKLPVTAKAQLCSSASRVIKSRIHHTQHHPHTSSALARHTVYILSLHSIANALSIKPSLFVQDKVLRHTDGLCSRLSHTCSLSDWTHYPAEVSEIYSDVPWRGGAHVYLHHGPSVANEGVEAQPAHLHAELESHHGQSQQLEGSVDLQGIRAGHPAHKRHSTPCPAPHHPGCQLSDTTRLPRQAALWLSIILMSVSHSIRQANYL